MDACETFDVLELPDPALFGLWPAATVLRDPPLETKSASAGHPAEPLRQLLNEMTVEMREQFAAFRAMREQAVAMLSEGDEAAQKLARADVKAASDAMSLIVRTLEKVDSLQRQLAHDRALEAERAADAGGFDEAKANLLRVIGEKVNEQAERRAKQLFEAWKRNGGIPAAATHAGGPGGPPANPPDEPQGPPSGRGEGGQVGGPDGGGHGAAHSPP